MSDLSQPSVAIERGGATLQDHAEVFQVGERTVIALADGAGGSSGGGDAAKEFVRIVAEAARNLRDPRSCQAIVERADLMILADAKGGETTGIVVVIDGGRVFGASVGDSAAWLFTAAGARELTRTQQRKPFLGTGAAIVRAFRSDEPGMLVVASDGLWKYASPTAIRAEVDRNQCAAKPLIELVRYPSGALPDDVAVVIAEV